MSNNKLTRNSLTPRQSMFCKEYLKDMNATQACIRAGYSRKSASRLSERLMSNEKVLCELEKQFQRRADRVHVDADYVLFNLKNIVERCKEGGDSRAYMSAVKALELLGKHLGLYEERIRIIHDDKSNNELVQELLQTEDMLRLVIKELGRIGYNVEIKDKSVVRLN